MLKRLFCCLAALFLFAGLCAEDEIEKNEQQTQQEKKSSKKSKKEKKSKKNKKKKKDKKTEKNTETDDNKKNNNAPAVIADLPSEEADWRRGPDKQWEVDFNKAAAKAKQEKKKLLVLVTGSDWCGWCKKLKSDVLSTKGFQKIANEKFVLVYVDFPRRSPLPQSQKSHNESVVKNIKASGGYPNVLIIDPNSLKTVGKIGGYAPAKKYIAKLKSLASSK